MNYFGHENSGTTVHILMYVKVSTQPGCFPV